MSMAFVFVKKFCSDDHDLPNISFKDMEAMMSLYINSAIWNLPAFAGGDPTGML